MDEYHPGRDIYSDLHVTGWNLRPIAGDFTQPLRGRSNAGKSGWHGPKKGIEGANGFDHFKMNLKNSRRISSISKTKTKR